MKGKWEDIWPKLAWSVYISYAFRWNGVIIVIVVVVVVIIIIIIITIIIFIIIIIVIIIKWEGMLFFSLASYLFIYLLTLIYYIFYYNYLIEK